MDWNKVRAALLIPSMSEWRRSDRIAKGGYVFGLVSLLFAIGWSLYTLPASRAYDLGGARRSQYLDLLRVAPDMHVDTLRIGCTPASLEACSAAGDFATLFSEAGWNIEGNQVFPVKTTKPVKSVTIASRDIEASALPQQPFYRGHLDTMDLSNQLLLSIFRMMDVSVHLSSDPDLPDNVLGIYFSADTDRYGTVSWSQAKLAHGLISLVKNGLVVKQLCSQEPVASCQADAASWQAQVTSYLDDQNLTDSDYDAWTKLKTDGIATTTSDHIYKQLQFLMGIFIFKIGPSFPN
jgi:hypothetical protein